MWGLSDSVRGPLARARSGLIRLCEARYAEQMTSVEAERDDPFERAWQEVERRWSDDAAHRQFIAFCNAQGALAEAGRRYRKVQERDPARSAQASQRLHAILGVALSTLELARPRPAPRRSKLFWMVCGVCTALFGYALLSVLRLLSR